MKIGEFSKKYNLKSSAVRYYIDKTLLTPDRENGQYIFTERCISQMDTIMKLKECRFSLEDIFLFLSYESLSELKDSESIDMIISLIQSRRESLCLELNELNSILSQLDELARSYNEKKSLAEYSMNFYLPLEFLSILSCPKCGSSLKLTDAYIEKEGVAHGQLLCNCGYHANINDGAIICSNPLEETPFKTFAFDDVLPSFNKDYSQSFRTMLNKCQLSIYHKLSEQKLDGKFIMSGPLSNLYIMNHLKNMPNSAYYIIVEPSIKRILKYKHIFCEQNKKIMFVTGDIDSAPIAKETLDIYIDDFSFSNFTTTYNRNLLEIISPLLKKNGFVTGLFLDYTKSPQSLRSLTDIHPGMDISLKSMKSVNAFMDKAGMTFTQKINLGSPDGTKNHFKGYVDGETFDTIMYKAVRK